MRHGALCSRWLAPLATERKSTNCPDCHLATSQPAQQLLSCPTVPEVQLFLLYLSVSRPPLQQSPHDPIEQDDECCYCFSKYSQSACRMLRVQPGSGKMRERRTLKIPIFTSLSLKGQAGGCVLDRSFKQKGMLQEKGSSSEKTKQRAFLWFRNVGKGP